MTATQTTAHAPDTPESPELEPFAGYIRVSDERGRSEDAERYRTIPMQQKRVRAIAASEGGYIAEWYIDEDEKGDDVERTRYSQMLVDVAERKRYVGIVAARLDRFGRKQSETIRAVEQLRDAQRRVIFAEPRLDTSDPITGPILLGVFSALAHIELVRIRETWRGIVDERVRELAPLSVPYGLVRRGVNGDGLHTATLVPDELAIDDEQPSAASVVRDIYMWRAIERIGWQQIADRLNERGVLTPTQLRKRRDELGKRTAATEWSHSAVYGLVHNRSYIGEYRFERRDKSGELVDRVVLPDAWTALVDVETFELAQSSRVTTGRNGRVRGSLLRGFVRCATCGRSMRPSRTGETLTYVCRGRAHGCERPASIVRSRVDPYVDETVGERLANPQHTIEAAAFDSELDKALNDRDRVRAARSRTMRLLSRYESDDDADAALAELDAELADAQRRVDTLSVQRDQLHGRRTTSSDVYRSLDGDEKRTVLADVVDAVFVAPAGRGAPVPVESRVAIAFAGQAPRRLLSGSGRSVANRRIDLDAIRAGAVLAHEPA